MFRNIKRFCKFNPNLILQMGFSLKEMMGDLTKWRLRGAIDLDMNVIPVIEQDVQSTIQKINKNDQPTIKECIEKDLGQDIPLWMGAFKEALKMLQNEKRRPNITEEEVVNVVDSSTHLQNIILCLEKACNSLADALQQNDPYFDVRNLNFYKEYQGDLKEAKDIFAAIQRTSQLKRFTKTSQVSEEPEVVIRDKNGLRIGIDIDGVLADTHNVLMDLASEHVPIDDEDRQKYGVQETKHGSDGLRNQVFEEIFEKGLIAEAPMIPGAAEKVNELYDAGNEIYIITARKKNWEEQTKEWLKKYNIKYHKLIMGAGKKGDVAKEEGIDVFIEDSPDNIENLEGNGIRAFVFSQPWNQDSHAERIEQWKNVKASKQSPTLEMEDFFKERTAKHIDLVNKYLEKLKEHYDYEFKDAHDNSKYADPEHEPYLYITWKHKMRDEDEDYEIPEEWKDKCDEATFHHIKNNRHHPEYWDDTLTENPINKENRDEPSGKIVDATKMPDEHILAMVADWCAMSEEKENTPKEWADKNIGTRWEFSPEQKELIYEAIERIWGKKEEASIRGFTRLASSSITIEVVRGIRGELANLARKGDPIYATSMGKWNFWAEKGSVGVNDALDSYNYTINLDTSEAEGVVISKTITLKVEEETNSVIFPKGWGATTYGADIGETEYTTEPQRWHVIPGSNAREAEVADKIPMERLKGAEIVSKGTITDYDILYDAKEQKQEAKLKAFVKTAQKKERYPVVWNTLKEEAPKEEKPLSKWQKRWREDPEWAEKQRQRARELNTRRMADPEYRAHRNKKFRENFLKRMQDPDYAAKIDKYQKEWRHEYYKQTPEYREKMKERYERWKDYYIPPVKGETPEARNARLTEAWERYLRGEQDPEFATKIMDYKDWQQQRREERGLQPGESAKVSWEDYMEWNNPLYRPQVDWELEKQRKLEEQKELEIPTETEKEEASLKSFTKFSSPRWTPEDKVRLKDLYIKYRQRGIPHHIIYKAVAVLLNKSWLAVKQKLESMYGLEDELKGMKFEHWDKAKIDKTIQDLYSTGKPINRINLPANLMYQITNHSMPKSQSQGFPTYYNSFDDAMANNILVIGFEREGDKLTEKSIQTLEDALKFYRRKEKLCHTWTKDEIVELLQEAHIVGLPLTYSFFRSHPDIYKPLMGIGRSLEGLRDSVKRNGHTWMELVLMAAPEYADFYSEDGRMKPSTEELRVRRFMEINNIPFRTAGEEDRLEVNDPELQILGYKHFVPDFIVLDKEGNVSAYVEVFGSVADSGASNTAELYREKKKAKEKYYSTLPYKFIAVNNNTDGIDLTDEILKQKFSSFIGDL